MEEWKLPPLLKKKKCTIEIISTFAANILLAVGEIPSFLIDLAKMIYS